MCSPKQQLGPYPKRHYDFYGHSYRSILKFQKVLMNIEYFSKLNYTWSSNNSLYPRPLGDPICNYQSNIDTEIPVFCFCHPKPCDHKTQVILWCIITDLCAKFEVMGVQSQYFAGSLVFYHAMGGHIIHWCVNPKK